MNQAETAFLVPEGPGQYGLRWYTPIAEVDLCGHATLASAHVLWTEALEQGSTIRFRTLRGTLTAFWTGRAGTSRWIFLRTRRDQERIPIVRGGAGGRGRGGLSCQRRHTGHCPIRKRRARYRTGFSTTQASHQAGCIVTAASDEPGIDFVSRFFAPAVGIDEDPVTGAAHCVLACYWGERLGRRSMTGYQASKRGGRVGVERTADRVRLSGSAVIVTRGELLP